MKLYFSLLCPDCPPVIKLLDEKKVDYEKVNITEDIFGLKEFIFLRDEREEFDYIINNKYLGIPCLRTNDDKLLFEDDIYDYIEKL